MYLLYLFNYNSLLPIAYCLNKHKTHQICSDLVTFAQKTSFLLKKGHFQKKKNQQEAASIGLKQPCQKSK